MENAEASTGVKFSAGLLVVEGCAVGFSALGGCALMIFLVSSRQARPGWYSTVFGFFLYLLLLGSFALACFRVASGLYQLRTRARHYGVGLGLFLLTLGIWMLVDVYSPARPGSFHGDDGFGVLMSPFLILPGAWLAVYLNLPHVYRQFSKLPS